MNLDYFISTYLQFNPDLIIRTFYALFVGFVLGIEREYHAKPAGIKTYAMICLGSTLITYMSLHLSKNADAARLAAQVVSGLGFIGAGTIFQSKRMITGLTTAATLWLVGSFGILIGAGLFLDTLICLIFVYIYFLLMRVVQRSHLRRYKYQIKVKISDQQTLQDILDLFEKYKLPIHNRDILKTERIVLDVQYVASKASHRKLVDTVMSMEGVLQLKV